MQEWWASVAEMQAKYYDQHHTPQEYKVRELVMLSMKNLKQQHLNRKLSHKFTGPFCILDIIGTQAYCLALPASYSHLHDVFHVSYLEPYNHQDGAVEVELMPPPELIEDKEEWEVEEIIHKKKIKGAVSYMVCWKGWSADYNEWVKESVELRGTGDLIQP